MNLQPLVPVVLAGMFATSAAAQSVFINDNFETDTSADYIIVNDGSPDGTQEFAFDYIAAGIPLAPNSAPGDTGGLKLTANDTAGAGDAWTLFHTNPVAADFYALHVDVWMNFTSGSGTTEFSEVGVGGDGVTYNSVFSPISGSGAFIAFTGDGGSSSDYRWFRAVPNTPMGETDNTTLPNSHPSYLGHGSNGSGSFFQSLFPSPPASNAGSPGNVWTTVRIEVDNLGGQISFYFDDQLTFQGDFANDFNGFASLSIADVFSSVSTANNFTLYDNFRVEVPTNTIGSNYCSAAVNSTGATGAVFAVGSEFASDNLVTLSASDLPTNSFGFFLTSMNQGFTGNPGGSQGNLCLSGSIGRYVATGQIKNSGSAGIFDLTLDLNQTPTPTGLVTVVAGDTWNFTAWHRDAVGGSVTSNFTDAVSITFQ